MNAINSSVALATGASSGIGEGIARMFAAESAKVTLARRGHELERVAEDIRQLGGKALPIPADLQDERVMQGVVDQSQNSFGPIDILVNWITCQYCTPLSVSHFVFVLHHLFIN